MNPVPVTVKVVAADPAETEVGFIAVTVGVGVSLPPPLPLPLPPLPLLPEEPPHPFKRAKIPRQKQARADRRIFIRV
jgi:hypothetical protein